MAGNIAVVRAVLAAFAARDIEAVVGLCHPDVLFAPVLARVTPGPQTYRGHAGLRAYFDDMARAWPDLDITETQMQQAGDAVVVVGNVSARTEHGELKAAAIWTWKVRDGLVSEVRVHSDEQSARSALGLG